MGSIKQSKTHSVESQAAWMATTLDIIADSLFGEFGYNTCTPEQQQKVLVELLENKELYGVELI